MSIEQKYTHKTQEEHVLYNPAMYIGNPDNASSNIWLYDETEKCLVYRTIEYNAALYKIFDEILSNAYDHSMRPNTKCTEIVVRISSTSLSVWNNGLGIDVVNHNDYNMYVPEFIFGKMMTSTNYTVKERNAIGVNGMGAVLTNIMSDKFTVTTLDSVRKLLFKQTFTNNMKKKGEPVITKSLDKPYTCIEFTPTYSKFNVDKLSLDMMRVYVRRCFDIAAYSNANNKYRVYVECKDLGISSKTPLPVVGFKDYVNLTLTSDVNLLFNEKLPNDDTYVAIGHNDGEPNHMSMVNANFTILGGTHVDSVYEQIYKHVSGIVKHNLPNVKRLTGLRDKLLIYVMTNVANPVFNSQSKDQLISPASIQLTPKMLTKIGKSSIVTELIDNLKLKEQQQINKKNKVAKSNICTIPNLEDAHLAGKKPHLCRLILTEGLSAKPFATNGLSIIGHDKYGVFPLKGKLLNTRDVTLTKACDNKELQNIMKIIGLEIGKHYTDVSKLRYGGIISLCDADYDGYHIVGLIMNFINTYWPELLKMDNFYCTMITPIVKVNYKKIKLSFNSIGDYEEWKRVTPNSNKYAVKYYKGLGTSTDIESKECFADMHKRLINFKDLDIEVDGTLSVYEKSKVNDQSAIELAFNKKYANDRKQWLRNYNEKDVFNPNEPKQQIVNFVHRMLIHFSNEDIRRNIPFVGDGFKPSQRKVIHTCMARNLYGKKTMKVAQLAGAVAELTAYHHGEVSLQDTIIHMARDITGTNNVPLLKPIGMFGTRDLGGKDSASARYIFTQVADVFEYIIRKEDSIVLPLNNDDGEDIEPVYFAPIVPVILLNGARGIGTGFSTYIPNYDLTDLIYTLQEKLTGIEVSELHPAYANFTGDIYIADKTNGYIIKGDFETIDGYTIRITELPPVDMCVSDYKNKLFSMRNENMLVADVKNFSEGNTVDIVVTLTEPICKYTKEELLDALHLSKSICMNNLHAYSYTHKRIYKYADVYEIINDFYAFRLHLYEVRRVAWLKKLENDMLILQNKVRFINEFISKAIIISNKTKQHVHDILTERDYNKVKDGTVVDVNDIDGSYDYLMSMPLYSLTTERKLDLQRKYDVKCNEYNEYMSTTPVKLWLHELNELLDFYAK